MKIAHAFHQIFGVFCHQPVLQPTQKKKSHPYSSGAVNYHCKIKFYFKSRFPCSVKAKIYFWTVCTKSSIHGYLLFYRGKVLFCTHRSKITHTCSCFSLPPCVTARYITLPLNRVNHKEFGSKLMASLLKKKGIYAELACIIHILHLIFVIQILLYVNGKKSIKWDCWEGPSVPPHRIPQLVSTTGTAEETEKENIVESLTYFHAIHRRCSQSFLFHEEMWAATVRAESLWSGHSVYSRLKHPKRTDIDL